MYQYDDREKTNLNVSKERRYDNENSTQDKWWATRVFLLGTEKGWKKWDKYIVWNS